MGVGEVDRQSPIPPLGPQEASSSQILTHM